VILEAAYLRVVAAREAQFEPAFEQASPLIAATPGYISHQLQRCLEEPGCYLLLVQWQTLQAHTEGFRGSTRYPQWKALLHHFYDPFPTVQHFEQVYPGTDETT
jgi:heme-degrading monooxygenase HmoA